MTDVIPDTIVRMTKNCAVSPFVNPGFQINGLAYDWHADRLYGIRSDMLYRINPVTLAVESLGSLGHTTTYAIGYHPIEKRLYAIAAEGISGGGYFFRINDPDDLGNQTFIAQLNNQNVHLTQALVYDPDSGKFFASSTNSPFRSLITIDPATGDVATIGSFGQGNLSFNGLAHNFGGACCTDGPGTESDCAHALKSACEGDGGCTWVTAPSARSRWIAWSSR